MFGLIGSFLKAAVQEDELENYYYIAYNTLSMLYNVELVAAKLQEKFTRVKTLVKDIRRRTVVSEIRSVVPEILFKADSLYATISPTRAVLFQKKQAPFTMRDLEFRKTLLELYPSKFTLPLFRAEPRFEILLDVVRPSLIQICNQDPQVQNFKQTYLKAFIQTIWSDRRKNRWIVIWSSGNPDEQQYLYVAIDMSTGSLLNVSREKPEGAEMSEGDQ